MVFIDPPSRLSAEERLRIADIVFESLDGIIISDLDRRIVAVNRAFTRITGFDAADVAGQPTTILRSGWHDDAFYQAIWDQVCQSGTWQGEIWNRRKTGEIYRWSSPPWSMMATGLPIMSACSAISRSAKRPRTRSSIWCFSTR